MSCYKCAAAVAGRYKEKEEEYGFKKYLNVCNIVSRRSEDGRLASEQCRARIGAHLHVRCV